MERLDPPGEDVILQEARVVRFGNGKKKGELARGRK